MPLTASQFRAVLKRLGLSQMEAARRLGVDPRTVRRWIAGDRRAPEPVALLLAVWLKERRAR